MTTAITAGTLARSDDAWPFAPMSQFTFAVDARDGEIHPRYLEATTDDGGRIRVDLARGGLGIQRGELEGQLWSLTTDPALQWVVFVMEALSPLILWLRGRPLYLFVGSGCCSTRARPCC